VPVDVGVPGWLRESDLGNRMLMVADLASLAEIAQGEGDYAEARRLAESALKLSGPLAHTDVAGRLRAILRLFVPIRGCDLTRRASHAVALLGFPAVEGWAAKERTTACNRRGYGHAPWVSIATR